VSDEAATASGERAAQSKPIPSVFPDRSGRQLHLLSAQPPPGSQFNRSPNHQTAGVQANPGDPAPVCESPYLPPTRCAQALRRAGHTNRSSARRKRQFPSSLRGHHKVDNIHAIRVQIAPPEVKIGAPSSGEVEIAPLCTFDFQNDHSEQSSEAERPILAAYGVLKPQRPWRTNVGL